MSLITLGSMEAVKVSQASLERVVSGTRTQINKIVLDYSTGKLSARRFEESMTQLLEDRHARAAVLGRQLAGDSRARNVADDAFARIVLKQEKEYLRNFTNDLLQGRYTDEEGNPKVSVIQQRALSYTGKLVGTANEAFAAGSQGFSFDWVMGGAEEHCEDCPRLAANSPYAWDALPTVPRANATQCKFHCRCYLKRNDGLDGFQPVE